MFAEFAKRKGRAWMRGAAMALLCGALATMGASCPSPAFPSDVPVYGYRVVAQYPHDSQAFTQGLLFHDGKLYESTGKRGHSTVRAVEIDTGNVLRQRELGDAYFGEGLALYNGNLYQLTWTSGTGFVYRLDTFEELASFSYSGEGWGLTFDGTHFILSDGSDTLRFYDPSNFGRVRTVDVKDNVGPLDNLNELEWVEGEVWANVWKLDRIARIDPVSGNVVGWIDLAGLLDESSAPAPNAGVLNGIAYDPATGRLFVTGKYWPRLFEIEIVPPVREDGE